MGNRLMDTKPLHERIFGVEAATPREAILERARETVGTRHKHYGSPLENFEAIARRWNAHLKNRFFGHLDDEDQFQLTASDVAVMMTDVKLARLENDPSHVDSWIDVAVYAACGGEVSAQERGE